MNQWQPRVVAIGNNDRLTTSDFIVTKSAPIGAVAAANPARLATALHNPPYSLHDPHRALLTWLLLLGLMPQVAQVCHDLN
jgi:hypothetical protein